MGKLTALSVKAIGESGRHGDGDGLYLNVAALGTKSWVQRIVINGKRRDIGLEIWPESGVGRMSGYTWGHQA